MTLQNWQLYCKDRDGGEVDLGGLASAHECVALEWAEKRANGGQKTGMVKIVGAHAFRAVLKSSPLPPLPAFAGHTAPAVSGTTVPFLPEGVKRVAPPKFKSKKAV